MRKRLLFGTLIVVATSITASARAEDTLEARVGRLEGRLDQLTSVLETLVDQLAGGQRAGSLAPLAVAPRVRPEPGAVPESSQRPPMIIVREKGPAALSQDAPRRPEPGAVPELEEDEIEEETPGGPRLAPRPAPRAEPRSVVTKTRSAVEDEPPPAAAADADADDVRLRIAGLQQRVAVLIEVTRLRQSQPVGGLTARHRAQLAELESQIELLESLLSAD